MARDDLAIWRAAKHEVLSGAGASMPLRTVVFDVDDLTSVYGSGFRIAGALDYLAQMAKWCNVVAREIERAQREGNT